MPALDILRGLVMVIMALDHTRDFFHSAAMAFLPEDLQQTTPAIFMTRWITHFCAPVFMFCAGAAAFLRRERGGTSSDLSRFLWTRGLWLIVLEFTVVHCGVLLRLRPRSDDSAGLLGAWDEHDCARRARASPVRCAAAGECGDCRAAPSVRWHHAGAARFPRVGMADPSRTGPADGGSASCDRGVSARALDRRDGARLLLRTGVSPRSREAPHRAASPRLRADCGVCRDSSA